MSDQFCSVRFLNELTRVSYKDGWLTCTVRVAHFHRDAGSHTTVTVVLRNRSMHKHSDFLEFSRWAELFENEIMAAAMIDRLTFRSHVLNMNVKDSYRLEQTLAKDRG